MKYLFSIMAAALALSASPGASGRSAAPGAAHEVPAELEGADVEEKLGAEIPLDLAFRDERGRTIRLGEAISGDLPVILTFNYSSCPMLCSVQLGGLVDVLTKMEWRAGEEFRIVTIGLDPDEAPARTRDTKQRYLDRYDAPKAKEGWRFLSGTEASIRSLAGAVGYGYRYHPDRDQYAHPAVAPILSPDGEVVSYLYGVSFEPERVRQILASASEGEQTESEQSFILACYHWVRDEGAAAVANMVMNYGASFFALAFVGAFGFFLFRQRKAKGSRES